MPKYLEYRAEQFIERAKEKYGNLYDYSQVNYVNQNDSVKVICHVHGAFYTSPKNFLSAIKKIGCPFCSRETRKRSSSSKRKTSDDMKSCSTNKFNVRGNTIEHNHLLLDVFK